MKKTTLLMAVALLSSSAAPTQARELFGFHPFQANYLEAHGYTNATVRKAFVRGFDCLAIGQEKYAFQATNPQRRRVDGVLCYGGVFEATITITRVY